MDPELPLCSQGPIRCSSPTPLTAAFVPHLPRAQPWPCVLRSPEAAVVVLVVVSFHLLPCRLFDKQAGGRGAHFERGSAGAAQRGRPVCSPQA